MIFFITSQKEMKTKREKERKSAISKKRVTIIAISQY